MKAVVIAETTDAGSSSIVIEDTDSLDILGVADKPFMVAGVDMIENRDFYLDFQNDLLWLAHEIALDPEIEILLDEPAQDN